MTDNLCWARLANPCIGEVEFRPHFKMYLCTKHNHDVMTIPKLNDIISREYKKFFPHESDRWTTK